mmetsp:Transcript_88271/g.227621  ORF Transcript_88271/g.227621 Transcript_88271/m.227621 type:complete len:438 (-) Transcript_88271:197-1510(-)|eukprot:CAMPEP_0195095300 /NCGR_PEP_ID=MMETSP0448-20130528/46763_1 /TAXON_ID=66468 /ORGANISM="Heterocapsa triquestra, Strain CCMP 448" /LENGTH=437 /DNA_ID=CAMNT_0040129491 /DNA_START=104 /DNA_END=1417 /DNA_ORIENTATION=+
MQVVPVSLADALCAPTPDGGFHSLEELPVELMDMRHQPRKVELSPQVMVHDADDAERTGAQEMECPQQDGQQPAKVVLPAEAMCFARQPSADEDPMALGRVVRSPPPAQPPSLSVLLTSPSPQSPPPAAPASLPPQFLETSPLSLPGEAACEPVFFEAAAPMAAEVGVLLPPDGFPALTLQFGDSPLAFWEGEVPHFSSMSPGLMQPAGSPSQGSSLHGAGHCRPCAWFWKPGGCQNDWACEHCHLCPEGEIKARKKMKQTMARLGLATPQPVLGAAPAGKLGFFSEREVVPCSATTCSEQETASGSEEESAAGRASSEPELAVCSEAEEGVELPPGLGLLQSAMLSPDFGYPALSAASGGSSMHGTGACKPCAWFWKPVGCQNAESCNFCHLCPESELKQRKKYKQAMMRMDLAAPNPGPADVPQAKYALNLSNLL